MEGSRIHIVLAAYNGAPYLREQLDSILANGRDDITIEICDDGSTDETVQIAREYEEKYEYIRVHENEKNLGYVKNFIEGIKRSQSPYIMLCDQDDIWDADKIARTMREMEKLEQQYTKTGSMPLLVFTDAMIFDSETGRQCGSFHEESHLDATKTDAVQLLMENKCIGCTVMINKAVLPYLDTLPDEVRVHDWWLALICSHFGKISYLAETTLQYRQHRGNMIGGSSFKDYVKKRVSELGRQRKALELTFAQGKAFYRMFQSELEEYPAVRAFARMGDAGFWRRRLYTIRYGFWKSGWIRNIALLMIL